MSIFGMEFKSNFGKMLAWLIVLAILTGLSMAFYQFMIDPGTKSIFDDFLARLSPSSQAIFGLNRDIDYTDLPQYIAFIFQALVFLVAMLAMQMTGNSLAKEQENGNIEYIYSNPVGRDQIYWNKFFANLLLFVVFIVLYAAITFGFACLLQPNTIRKADLLIEILKIFLSVFVTGLVYLGLGMFLSSLTSRAQTAEAISVLLVLLSGIAIALVKIFVGESLAGFFILEGFNPPQVLLGSMEPISLIIGGVIFLLSLLFGYLIYNAKELKY